MASPIPFDQSPDAYGINKADAVIYNPTATDQITQQINQRNQLRDQEIRAEAIRRRNEADQEDKIYKNSSSQFGSNVKFATGGFQAELSKRQNDLRNEGAQKFAATGENPYTSDPEFQGKLADFNQAAYASRSLANDYDSREKDIEKKGSAYYTPESVTAHRNSFKRANGTQMSIDEASRAMPANLDPSIDLEKTLKGYNLKPVTITQREGNNMVTRYNVNEYRNTIASTLDSPTIQHGLAQQGLKIDASQFVHADRGGTMHAIDPNDKEQVSIVSQGLLSHPDFLEKYGIDNTDPDVVSKVNAFVKKQAQIVYDYNENAVHRGSPSDPTKVIQYNDDRTFALRQRQENFHEQNSGANTELSRERLNLARENQDRLNAASGGSAGRGEKGAARYRDDSVEARNSMLNGFINKDPNTTSDVYSLLDTHGITHKEIGSNQIEVEIPSTTGINNKTVIDLTRHGAKAQLNEIMNHGSGRKISNDDLNGFNTRHAREAAGAQAPVSGAPGGNSGGMKFNKSITPSTNLFQRRQ